MEAGTKATSLTVIGMVMVVTQTAEAKVGTTANGVMVTRLAMVRSNSMMVAGLQATLLNATGMDKALYTKPMEQPNAALGKTTRRSAAVVQPE